MCSILDPALSRTQIGLDDLFVPFDLDRLPFGDLLAVEKVAAN
jgi:hypothetical protein